MKAPTNPKAALISLMRWCAVGERAESDAQRKLKKWGIDETESIQILIHLKKEGYINPNRYLKSFINDKLKFERWGRVKIAYELQKKGYDTNDIQIAFSSSNFATYKDDLLSLLQRKSETFERPFTKAQKVKLVNFALSRGYEMPLVMDCLRAIDK